MIIDKLTIGKEEDADAKAGIAKVSLNIQATICDAKPSDLVIIDSAIERFRCEISGTPVPKKRTGAQMVWSDEERGAITKAASSREAVVLYRETFPESTRQKSGITRMWLYLKDRGKITPSSPRDALTISPKKAHKPAKKSAQSESGRNNAMSPRWSEGEKSVVDNAKDPETAWVQYQVRFPRGSRNKNAVYQRWQKHHKAAPAPQPERKDPAVAPAAKGAVPPTPVKKPEPVGGARPREIHARDLKITEEPLTKTPAEQPAATPSGGVKTPNPLEADKDLLNALPDERPPTGPEKKNLKRPTIIGLGTAVKHNGPKSSPFFGKEGKVVKMGSGSQILVNFGESSQWLSTSSVEPVPAVAG